jgi:hypothetical protein
MGPNHIHIPKMYNQNYNNIVSKWPVNLKEPYECTTWGNDNYNPSNQWSHLHVKIAKLSTRNNSFDSTTTDFNQCLHIVSSQRHLTIGSNVSSSPSSENHTMHYLQLHSRNATRRHLVLKLQQGTASPITPPWISRHTLRCDEAHRSKDR